MKLSRKSVYCFIVICLITILVGCSDNEPIKVGFAAPLSGTLSDYGLSCRRGVVLAVEELNMAGGIKGQEINLIIKDDKNDPAEALKVDLELIDEGVAAIIGNFTSTTCMATLPEMNKKSMLLISPAASTTKLSGKDDFFFRTIEADDRQTLSLARYAYESFKARKAALIYDISNRAYSESYIRSIERFFKELGGRTIVEVAFDSKDGLGDDKINLLLKSDSDVAFLVAGTLDAATLVQELAKQNKNLPVISSPWAMHKDFIENGGMATEGTIFAGVLNINHDAPRLIEFKKNFLKRFGEAAEIAAAGGYNAAMALKVGLENTSLLTSESIKKAILKHRIIPTLTGDFPLDRYGDIHLPFMIFKVVNGDFKLLKISEPE